MIIAYIVRNLYRYLGGVARMGECITDVYCNACGMKIEVIPKANINKEYLSIEKEWGYFSNKDFMLHSFAICEKCYDQWVETFVIPINKQVQTEWAVTLPEETLIKERESHQ